MLKNDTLGVRKEAFMPRVNLGMDIGDWVARKLKRSGYSQTRAAKEMGISQQVLSRKILNNNLNYEDLCSIFRITGAEDEEITRVMKGVF